MTRPSPPVVDDGLLLPTTLNVRPEVAAFAVLMERELQANDHKPGWKSDSPEAIAKRVEEEAGELAGAVRELERQIVWAEEPSYGSRGGNGWSRTNQTTGKREVGVGYAPLEGERRQEQFLAIASEAADVANMAMMVADVCGQLDTRPTPSVVADEELVERMANAIVAALGTQAGMLFSPRNANIAARAALAASDRDVLVGRIAELERLSGALVAKLDECAPNIVNLSAINYARTGVGYTGPSYGEALEALRAALVPLGGGGATLDSPRESSI